jgi:choline dehydrogenase-like flavoprotein
MSPAPGFHWSECLVSLDEAARETWDAIVIGGGMGGGALTHRLAAHGRNVLVVERGHAEAADPVGVETELTDPNDRMRSGHWPEQIDGVIDGSPSRFWAPLGCGLGGSSLLYAAALQRLRRRDFEPIELPNGEVVSWPFSYEDLEPYYSVAEQQLSVRGTRDPLEDDSGSALLPPPAMSGVDRELFARFANAGLNPYRLHVGIRYDEGCGECAGRVCSTGCKRDAMNAFLQPAVQRGTVRVVDRTEALRLEADEDRVTSLLVQRDSRQAALRSAKFVLSAGAYFTPVLLQRSRSVHWPDGLANRSGMVGRNLMFHAGDLIAIWARGRFDDSGPRKVIALRDFYDHEGDRLGEIQSTGLSASYGYVLFALRSQFDRGPLAKVRSLREALRVPAWIAAKVLGDATILAALVEDFPYLHNRVIADDDAASGMRFEYRIDDDLKRRVMALRSAFSRATTGLPTLPFSSGVTLNYGHPCGTCRAGEDAHHSVVNGESRAHDLDNLYVADASFMPTSGGTNPSLTIAANALRIADRINAQL